jgi:hypothetical protein
MCLVCACAGALLPVQPGIRTEAGLSADLLRRIMSRMTGGDLPITPNNVGRLEEMCVNAKGLDKGLLSELSAFRHECSKRRRHGP